MIVFVDNQGSCDIYRKGYSTSCFYSYIVAKAIYDVSQALNCTVHVQKIKRCSDTGSLAADMLSKADFLKFYQLMPKRKINPGKIPKSLLNWLMNPGVCLDLGDKMCKELCKETKLLGY